MKLAKPDVALVMGSASDGTTMEHAVKILEEFNINYSYNIVSAHRTPDRLYEFGSNAHEAGIKVIIAGAGGAAHLPGMLSSLTTIPVLGVPIDATSLNGIDSLYSISQMPAGVPVATFAIGKAGAINAALFAISIVGLTSNSLMEQLRKWRDKQTASVPFTIPASK